MKNLKKYHKVYLVFFVLMCVVTACLGVRAVLHPRPHNILVTLMSVIWVFCIRGWMNPEKFESPYKRKKPAAGAVLQGEPAGEQSEAVTKKKRKAPGIGMAVLGILLSFFVVVYMLSVIPDILFPYHAPYEYKADIAKRRLSTFYDYSFFPDEIPEGASCVKWVMQPSFLQGSGTEVLIFDTDDDHIRQTIAQYGSGAEVVGLEDDMMFDNYYDKNRLDKLKVYKLYDNNDRNHLHMWGFFVDEEIGRIGYFCQ